MQGSVAIVAPGQHAHYGRVEQAKLRKEAPADLGNAYTDTGSNVFITVLKSEFVLYTGASIIQNCEYAKKTLHAAKHNL